MSSLLVRRSRVELRPPRTWWLSSGPCKAAQQTSLEFLRCLWEHDDSAPNDVRNA